MNKNSPLRKINIFHLSPFPYYSGGICTWLNNLLHSLDGEFDVTVYCPRPTEEQKNNNPIHDIADLETVHFVYVGQFRSYLTMIFWAFHVFLCLFNKVDKNAKTIVLSTIPTMFPVILLKIFRRLQGDIICSVRGQISKDSVEMKKSSVFQWFVKFVEGQCINRADHVVANGWDTQDFIKEYFSSPSQVIPNGYLKKQRDRVPVDKDVGIVKNLKKQDKIIFTHVGTVRKVKCIDYILDAVRILKPVDREKAAFVFVGKGMIREYSKIAKDYGIEVYFLDEKRYVQPYFEMSDYVINVSGGSGISNSLVEALSAGRPVITWDNMTFTQIINDGVNGITCEHHNAFALATGLQRAINEFGVFNADAIKASAQDFQWDKIVEKWKALLQD